MLRDALNTESHSRFLINALPEADFAVKGPG
jgi:hypothetical protein